MLTINADLQEIAEKSLADAVSRMGAEGGDIVILDPHTGEILAMASRRLDPRQTSATVITEPFEPGSTAKPFMAAGLLERGRVDGSRTPSTRATACSRSTGARIRSTSISSAARRLADVLRWSSNIGIVKFAQRLLERERVRDACAISGSACRPAFRTRPNPAECCARRKSWSNQSANSMAMGYEIAVTPLQLAAAYAAFANGGELVEPALVKEIIAPDGDGSLSAHAAHRPSRDVGSRSPTRFGTCCSTSSTKAPRSRRRSTTICLAGKTGTPRGTVKGHYVAGRYNPELRRNLSRRQSAVRHRRQADGAAELASLPRKRRRR